MHLNGFYQVTPSCHYSLLRGIGEFAEYPIAKIISLALGENDWIGVWAIYHGDPSISL